MGRLIPYLDGEQPLEGYFAPPQSNSPAPGVLIAPTWLSITESMHQRADRLANLGYAAFVLDVFGAGVRPVPPQTPQAIVHPFMSDRHRFRTRLKAGLEALQQQPECHPNQIAAMGYCFGGCAVLELARSGAPLQGVVSFHGELDTSLPAQPGIMQAKILVLHGDADPIVPFEKLIGFREEMRSVNANWEIDIYSDAKHSFTGEGAIDQMSEAGLNPQVEARSWQKMLNFLAEVLPP
ncbi:MAG: dienelactone hydrolase family protein [Leptolyngbya sp. BL-A-14]